jgi:sigma-E factor negative regulatory protein RseC
MKTKAIVTAVDGRFATVETTRTSACEGCHKATEGEGCSVCSLMGGEKKLSSKAYNPVGAKVGDTVMVESSSARMLWYAALVFLVPILVAILGYFVALWCGGGEGVRIGAAFLGFIGTFSVIFAYSSIVRKKRCDIEIVEIIGNQAD